MNDRRAPLIIGIVAGVIALLLIIFLVVPKMNDVSETNKQVEQAQQEELTLQAQLQALRDAQAAAPETKAQIAKIDKAIPATPELPQLITQLTQIADSSAVDFFTFSPGTPTPDATGTYSVMTSSINVTGTYFSVDEYLYRLETLQRAAKVTSINLAPGASSSEGSASITTSTLTMTLSVNFFTTDTMAGPGTVPEDGAAAPTPSPSPTPSPTPGA